MFLGSRKKFSKIEGIVETEVGYCGGKVPGVTYKEVCSGETEHAEVVKLTFDAEKISYEKIIEYFFDFHDPTTLNRQGPDIGSQYRSEIFFYDEEQKRISLSIIEKISKNLIKKLLHKFRNPKIILKQRNITKNI